MLNISGSNLRYPVHIAFLGLHAVGMIFGLAYKSKTPNLYPESCHGTLGWVLTILIIAHFIAGALMRSFPGYSERDARHELTPLNSSENQDWDDQSSSPRDIYLCPSTSECPTRETHFETAFNEPASWSRPNISLVGFRFQFLDITYDTVQRLLSILGFCAICTGIVTMAGIFVCR
jgi:Domain of unknown function (DUF2427)